MAAVVALIQPEVLHPKVRGKIHNQRGAGVEYVGRHFAGFAVLEGEVDDILASSRLARFRP